MKEALQSLIERFQGVRHAWPQVPEVAFSRDHVWYAGLAVCPVQFSQQLVSLQLSLQEQAEPAPLTPEKPSSTLTQ
jgi:hypothetical protein